MAQAPDRRERQLHRRVLLEGRDEEQAVARQVQRAALQHGRSRLAPRERRPHQRHAVRAREDRLGRLDKDTAGRKVGALNVLEQVGRREIAVVDERDGRLPPASGRF